MPRNTNPEDIAVGSGTAGEESVTASSLTVNLTTVEGGGTLGGVTASDVFADSTLGVGDDDVQGNLDILESLAPTPRPNLLGETSAPYPSSVADWTFSDPFTYGRVATSATPTAVVNNLATLTVSDIPLFPADRGILAVTVDLGGGPQVLHALDLAAIFLEGNGPEDIGGGGLDSRWKGQPDYTADSSTAGDVAGAAGSITQGFSLTDRRPITGTAPWDQFNYTYYGYQIATASVEITLRSENNGIVKIKHYKTEQDLINDEAGSGTVNTYADVSLFVDTGDTAFGEVPLYNDPDTATNVVINSFSLGPNNTTTSGDSRTISGVTYYGPTDQFTLTYSVDGLYTFTFLQEGVKLRLRGPSDQWGVIGIPYTDYTPGSPSPGSTASDTDAAYLITGGYVTGGNPRLIASDPTDEQDIAANAVTQNLLINTKPNFGVVNATQELFGDEVSRYGGAEILTTTLLPDGTGSGWSTTAQLGPGDLQVRGAPSSAGVPAGLALGGELSWPTENYSTNHYPTTRNGSDPQYDYSAIAAGADGFKRYYRAFDAGSASKQIRVRVQGRYNAGTLWEGLSISDISAGSASGASLFFLTQSAFFSTGLREAAAPVEIGGSLLDVVEEDDDTVVLTLQLVDSPVKVGTYFPVIFVARFTESTPSGTGNFALSKVEIL